jgi:hypothetical protein
MDRPLNHRQGSLQRPCLHGRFSGSLKRTLPVPALFAMLATAGVTFADDPETPAEPPPPPTIMNWLASGGPANPLEVTRLHAGVAANGLSDNDTGVVTQEKEHQVMTGLEAMIRDLEAKKKKRGSGGGSAHPSTPASKSTLAKGPGGSGPLHAPGTGNGGMGSLQLKEREQIQQSQTEGFPAGYDSVLSNYYTRLSQEQAPTDAKPADAKPSDAKPADAKPADAKPAATLSPAPAGPPAPGH